MLFSRKSELETAVNVQDEQNNAEQTNVPVTYELRSFTEMPRDPKYSARKPASPSSKSSAMVQSSSHQLTSHGQSVDV
jgi:hypothetical protein